MAYTGIKSYAKPHGSGQSNGGSIIQVINKGGANNFDPNYVNINTLEAHNGNIDNLRVKSATIDNAQFKYIMSPNGIINKVQGDELDYAYGNIDELASSNINTTKLTVKDEANIKNLINEYLKTNEIVTDKLTVNKSAHFFELIVDKMRSVQGTQMNTAANCVIDYVEAYDNNGNLVDMTADDFNVINVNYYRIYWKNTDDDGKTINNEWLPFDQAICSTFNVKEGTTQNASNKYYWRLVNGTDNGEVRYINFKTGEVKNTKPETFEIIFTNGGFQYGDTTDTSNNYTNFTVTSQITDEYIPGLLTWRPSSTLYGIQVVANQNDHRILAGGGFIFKTDIPTKLNVGVYYDDGTYDYFQAQEYTTSYNIITAAKKNAEAFIICTAELDKWESCNWIDLSNIDYDITGTSIPEAGDNLCQLGYRYLDAVDPNKKSRASAIIIAAYSTPDKGIVPPSYAQYQDIQDFNLSSHRGTYFDATGAYIKGNLVSGTVIEPDVNIPIVVDTWKIVADYSIITKDNENHITPSTITLALLHNNGTSSSIVTSLPADKAIYVNNVLNSGGLTIPVTSFENLTITLTDTAKEQIFDKIIIETFDINATNGTDGIDGTNAFNNVFTYDKMDVTVTVSGKTLSEITSGLRVNIDNLKMVHVEKGAATDTNFFAKGYTLCLDVLTFNKAYKKSFIANTSTTQLWTVTNGTSASISASNILFDMYPMPKPPYYRDYFKLQESNNDYLPVQLVIYMLDENNVQCTDKLRIDINMQAGYINQISKAGLYQAFFGSYTKDGQTVNGMSSITATMEGISTNVQSISDTVSEHSTFIQESGKFQTTITQQVNDLNGNVTSMQSQITQLPDQITAEVNDGLKSTGINIENGKIILQADSTEITGDTLTLNQNQGILITDGDTFNNISIKASDIESFGRDVVYNLTFDTNKYGKQIHHYDRGSSSYTWSWANEQYFEIGYLYKNSVVKENIKGIFTELYYKNNTEVRYKSLAADPIITLYLKDGNNYTPVYNQWDYNGSFTIQTSGEYFIGIGDVTYTYESQNINGDDTYARVIAKFDVTAKGNNNVEIGTNGYNVVINNTTKAGSADVNYDFINYMNKDEWVVEDVTNTNNNHSTLLRNRTGLKITNHNVPLQKGCYEYQEQKYDTWSTVGTIMNIRSISDNVVNVNAAYDYYLLTGGTSTKTFNMTPSANTCLPIGKIIYIKNISSYTVNCNAGSSQYPLLINLNKNSAVATISLSAGQQASFIWTGQYFIRIS